MNADTLAAVRKASSRGWPSRRLAHGTRHVPPPEQLDRHPARADAHLRAIGAMVSALTRDDVDDVGRGERPGRRRSGWAYRNGADDGLLLRLLRRGRRDPEGIPIFVRLQSFRRRATAADDQRVDRPLEARAAGVMKLGPAVDDDDEGQAGAFFWWSCLRGRQHDDERDEREHHRPSARAPAELCRRSLSDLSPNIADRDGSPILP